MNDYDIKFYNQNSIIKYIKIIFFSNFPLAWKSSSYTKHIMKGTFITML